MSRALTIVEIAAQLERGETRSEALTGTIVTQIEEHNPAWRIFTNIFHDRATRTAIQSDKRRAKNQSVGALEGIPIAVKDNLHLRGYPTTAGTAYDFSAGFEHTATVVERLENAGAIVIGSCTMDEGALGATTNNPHTGQCVNPARPGTTPGGSSGGSAAAVAAGWAVASVGTDTLGSVRIPAAYCHLWSIKPTHGMVPTAGLVPLCTDLDAIGPIAHNAQDLKAVLTVMAAHPDAESKPGQKKRINIAVGPESLLSCCESEVVSAFSAFLDKLGGDGVATSHELFEFWHPGKLRRDGLVLTEVQASKSLARQLVDHPDAFSNRFHAMMQYGRSVSAERLETSVRRIQQAREHTLALLDKYNYLLLPAAPQLAFSTNEQAPDNQADFTTLASITGCPAVAFPIPVPSGGNKTSSDKVCDQPVFASAQLLGKPGSDFELLSVAEQLCA